MVSVLSEASRSGGIRPPERSSVAVAPPFRIPRGGNSRRVDAPTTSAARRSAPWLACSGCAPGTAPAHSPQPSGHLGCAGECGQPQDSPSPGIARIARRDARTDRRHGRRSWPCPDRRTGASDHTFRADDWWPARHGAQAPAKARNRAPSCAARTSPPPKSCATPSETAHPPGWAQVAETAERLVRDGRTLEKGRHLQADKQAFTLERPSADPATRADPPGAGTTAGIPLPAGTRTLLITGREPNTTLGALPITRFLIAVKKLYINQVNAQHTAH